MFLLSGPKCQFVSHVGTEPPFPASYQYNDEKFLCLAQGKNLAPVRFKARNSQSLKKIFFSSTGQLSDRFQLRAGQKLILQDSAFILIL